MEPLTRVILRARGGGKKSSARKLWRSLQQSNQGRRILRHADDLKLVTLDPKLRHIGAVGQRLRKRLKHNDARWARLLALRKKAQRRPAGVRVETQRGTTLRNPVLQLLLFGIQRTADIGCCDQGSRRCKSGGQQHDAQDVWHVCQPPGRSAQRLLEDPDFRRRAPGGRRPARASAPRGTSVLFRFGRGPAPDYK